MSEARDQKNYIFVLNGGKINWLHKEVRGFVTRSKNPWANLFAFFLLRQFDFLNPHDLLFRHVRFSNSSFQFRLLIGLVDIQTVNKNGRKLEFSKVLGITCSLNRTKVFPNFKNKTFSLCSLLTVIDEFWTILSKFRHILPCSIFLLKFSISTSN